MQRERSLRPWAGAWPAPPGADRPPLLKGAADSVGRFCVHSRPPRSQDSRNSWLYTSLSSFLAASRSDDKGKGSPYSITERMVPELIPVLGSQPAGDVRHKPGGRLPLLSARPAVTPATPKRAATSFAAW